MTASRGSDTAPGDLLFPLRESNPLEDRDQNMSILNMTGNFWLTPLLLKTFSHNLPVNQTDSLLTSTNLKVDLLDELPEETCGAENHSSSLRLLRL